jgi:hypothetical protein
MLRPGHVRIGSEMCLIGILFRDSTSQGSDPAPHSELCLRPRSTRLGSVGHTGRHDILRSKGHITAREATTTLLSMGTG